MKIFTSTMQGLSAKTPKPINEVSLLDYFTIHEPWAMGCGLRVLLCEIYLSHFHSHTCADILLLISIPIPIPVSVQVYKYICTYLPLLFYEG